VAANSGNVGTGVGQAPETPTDWNAVLQKIVCKCDQQVKANKQSKCRELGTLKHDCCNKEVQKHKNKSGPGRKEQLAPERGYTNPFSPPSERINAVNVVRKQFPRSCWPDAVLLDPMGKPKQLFDFKFRCPDGVRKHPKPNKPMGFSPGRKGRPGQLAKYLALGNNLGIDNNANPPTVVHNENCP
jgi:hypothetical protein